MNFQHRIWVILFLTLMTGQPGAAGEIRVLQNPPMASTWTEEKAKEFVNRILDPRQVGEIRLQVFSEHMVLQVFKPGYHRVDFIRVDFDQQKNITRVQENYEYSLEELQQQDRIRSQNSSICPDPQAQVLAFAPNDQATEQEVTQAVIQSAQAHGFKVVPLLKADATRANYLAYMTCPNLIGNFYDGDSNPTSFITVDGVIGASEMSQLKGVFRYHVTNIWVACEAFNNPMLSSLTIDDQSQKYAAGINDLLVGPSDQAAACAMEAAFDGQPMTAAFQACYQKLDNAEDHWGFAGAGSDLFGY